MQTVLASGAISISGSLDIIVLYHATVKIEAVIAAPRAGHTLIIVQGDAGTVGHTVTLTSGAFDTVGHNVLTLNAQNECIILYGESSSQYITLVNIGSVALS